ncbi:MAG: hypothetical protein Cons2KO_10120 [Congregibacter sp.]
MNRYVTPLHSAALIMAAICAVSSPCTAQTIDTNRPGFTYAPTVVPTQKLQLESGIAYDGDSDRLGLPQLELRYGVASGAEVFLSSLNWDDGDRADLVLGTKLNLDGLPSKTQMAVLLQVSAPTGDDSLTTDRWDPSAALIWAHQGRFSLAGTARVTRFADRFQFDNGLKLVIPTGPGQTSFVEWELNWPEGRSAAHWVNAGHQWLLSEQFQLDINAGVGINDRAGSYRLGVGLSRLF